MTLTRGLIEYDCAAAKSCAANNGRCGCRRRWAGETAPFPIVGKRVDAAPKRVPEPKLGDVWPEMKRRVG